MGNAQQGSKTSAGKFVQNVNTCIAGILRDQRNVLSLIRKEVGEEIISDRELDEFLTMVNNRMVLVPIIGEGSSGKSTLINALLGDIFLPFGCPKVTATRTYIRHDPKIHRGPCKGNPCKMKNCPKLYKVLEVSKEDTTPLAEGASRIQEKLWEYNESAPDSSEVPDMLLISANIPVFEQFEDSPLVHYLVDCPGLEYLKNDTERYITVVSAVIYTHNYRRFLQNPEKIEQDLIERPKYAKVLFAAVQFDAFYEPGSGSVENPSQELVKKHVAETFPDIIMEEDVFPASGKWALYSRILERSPENSDARFIVQQAYAMYSRKYECDVDADERSTVFEKSEIQYLEEGVKEVLSTIDHQVWIGNVKAKCEEFLSLPINKGEEKLRKLAAELQTMVEEAMERENRLRMISEQRQELQANTDFEVVTKGFQEQFGVKNALKIIEGEVTIVIQEFIDRYKDRLPLPLQQFEADLREFESTGLPVKIKDVLTQKANDFLQIRLTRLNTIYCTLEANTTMYIEKTSAQVQADFGPCQLETNAATEPSIKVITAASELWEQHKSSKRRNYALAGAILAAGVGITSLPISSLLVLGIGSLGTISSGMLWLIRTWNTAPTLNVSELEQAEKKLKYIISEWVAKNERYCTSTILALSQDVVQKILLQSTTLLNRYDEKWSKPMRKSDIQVKKLLGKIEDFQKREFALSEAVEKLKTLQPRLHKLELDPAQQEEEPSESDNEDLDYLII